MSNQNHDELTRPQLKQIMGLSRTLTETAEELLKFSNRRHPEAHYATWLIRQAHERIHKILKQLDEIV